VKSKIIVGNSLAVLAKMSANSVGAIVTDPPYCQGSTNGVSQGTGAKYVQTGQAKKFVDFSGDNRPQRALQQFLNAVFLECFRIAKPGTLFACFFDFRNLTLATDAAQLAGFSYIGLVPWDKTLASRPLRPFRRQCEYIGIFRKGALIDPPCLPGIVTSSAKNEWHQTQKPDVVMDHVLSAIKPGTLVIDPFCGSGSTGVAALKRGCDFIGIEMVPEIAAIAKKRLKEAK
jgi:site-specific DNA-methyltransferase (adenine-specific)